MASESTSGGNRANRAPGPKGLPIFGSALPRRNPLDLIVDSSSRYGDYVSLTFGPFQFLLVNDPAGVHHVLVDNAKNYTKSRNYDGLKLLLGRGLLTSEGTFWRRQRKLAQPAFHREKIAAFADAMVGETDAMLARWTGFEGGEFDLHAEMMKVTLRIVARTLFSTAVGAEADAIGEALTFALHHTNEFVEALVRVPQWLPLPKNLRFKRAVKTLDALVYRIIDERRAGHHADAGDLLAMLMAATEDGESMSNQQLRDEIMTLVMAGHETTANALAWAFHALSKAPQVERRLRAEITDVLGDRAPTLEDLPKLKYTKQVIEETMRLYPPAWAFERRAIEADRIGGFDVAAGTTVAMAPFILHRHPKYWENPEGFDPDRFTPERAEGRPKFAYLPFGGGPRVCIGNGFAMMEAQLILARTLQKYRVSLVAGREVRMDPVVTLRPRGGLTMTLERAADLAKAASGTHAKHVVQGKRAAAHAIMESRLRLRARYDSGPMKVAAVSLAMVALFACSSSSAPGGGSGTASGSGGGNGGGAPIAIGSSENGIITYYTTADGTGACSFDASPNDLDIAAMNIHEWNGSAVCGECVAITGPKGSVTVRVVDECPDCVSGQLDLSQSAFAKVADVSAGRVNVTWQAVSCGVAGNVAYHYKDGTNPYWAAIQVRNSKLPIAKLEVKSNGNFQEITRADYNYFVVDSGTGSGNVDVRITAVDGQTIEDSIAPAAANLTVNGASQFQ